MNIDSFWDIIDSARTEATSTGKPIETCLISSLRLLPKSEVMDFSSHANLLYHKAYNWDLWAGAYILRGGCPDDSFMDFRQALIGLGRERFERSLKNPDSLADLNESDLDFLYTEMFLNFLDEVDGYEEASTLNEHPKEPTGERWEENELQDRFPKLSSRFGHISNMKAEAENTQTPITQWPVGSEDWAFKTCDSLMKEINSAIEAPKFNPEDLHLIIPAIDLILYVSQAAMIYPWENQKVSHWRSRILELLDSPNELTPYFQNNLAEERSRFIDIFDQLEAIISEEHI